VTGPPLLTQNSELRDDGIWNWTLPAWVVRLSDGRSFNVCPSAGACAKVCYARNGTYLFPAVAAAHLDNLRAAFSPDFPERMLNEPTGPPGAPTSPACPGRTCTRTSPGCWTSAPPWSASTTPGTSSPTPTCGRG
jgi:hypothetical protein